MHVVMDRYHHPPPELCCLVKGKFCPHEALTPSLPPPYQPLATAFLLCVSRGLTPLGTPCEGIG